MPGIRWSFSKMNKNDLLFLELDGVKNVLLQFDSKKENIEAILDISYINNTPDFPVFQRSAFSPPPPEQKKEQEKLEEQPGLYEFVKFSEKLSQVTENYKEDKERKSEIKYDCIGCGEKTSNLDRICGDICKEAVENALQKLEKKDLVPPEVKPEKHRYTPEEREEKDNILYNYIKQHEPCKIPYFINISTATQEIKDIYNHLKEKLGNAENIKVSLNRLLQKKMVNKKKERKDKACLYETVKRKEIENSESNVNNQLTLARTKEIIYNREPLEAICDKILDFIKEHGGQCHLYLNPGKRRRPEVYESNKKLKSLCGCDDRKMLRAINKLLLDKKIELPVPEQKTLYRIIIEEPEDEDDIIKKNWKSQTKRS